MQYMCDYICTLSEWSWCRAFGECLNHHNGPKRSANGRNSDGSRKSHIFFLSSGHKPFSQRNVLHSLRVRGFVIQVSAVKNLPVAR